MSYSDEKLDVTLERVSIDGAPAKLWAKVTLRKSGHFFYPSFEDLYRIIRAIGHCEDVKYPNGQGRDMVKKILADSVYCSDWGVLADRYHIPTRNGGPAHGRWSEEVAQQLELVDLQMTKAAVLDLQERRRGRGF